MRRRQLLGSQRPRCAISTLNYFPDEVWSFPSVLEFSFHFEDEMFLRREDFVTPRPGRVYST